MPRFSNWRLTPRGLFRLLLALLLALAYAYNSRAQEAISPADDAETLVAADLDLRSEPVRAALASIQARNPDNAIEWVKAVTILRRMGAHAEAMPYLDQATGANLSLQEMVDLHQAIGTAELVSLSVDQELPAAREFVFAVFDAVRRSKRDAKLLADAVEKLSSNDARERSQATVQLADAGAFCIPALVTALQADPPATSLPAAESVIQRLGMDAEEPLLALLGAPDAQLQALAAKMLGRIESKRASLHLIRPHFVGATAAKKAAAEYFQHLGSQPSSVQGASSILLQRAHFHLQGNPPVAADVDGIVPMWTWNADEKNIVPHQLDARGAGAVVAARFARDAYELSPTANTQRMLLVSRLQVDQTLGGRDELLPRGVGSAYQLGITEGLDAVLAAFDYSVDHGFDAATQGAAELVAHYCQNRSAADWNGLTRVLRHPNRRVRFAAVRAIMAVDPRSPYAGSSFFQDALIELATAGGSPNVIVAMSRRDAQDNLIGKLNSFGFTVRSTNQGTRLLELASRTSDVDVVFLSDSISRPTARETIQRLRHHHFTAQVPIVLTARRDNLVQAERIAAIDPAEMTFVVPEFVSDEALSSVLENAESLVRDTSVSPAQRLTQARDALSWLSHLAQYSQTYSWYNLQRAEATVIRASVQPELAAVAVPLLGYLGGSESQRQLLDLVGRKDLSTPARQRAANAFTEAVARRGLMLKSDSIYGQYDRYNASEQEPLAVQELLGQVLDVIETQTRPSDNGVTSF